MGWLEWIGPAIAAGSTLYSMFSDDSDDMQNQLQHQTALNRQQANRNSALSQEDYARLFDYWLAHQEHYGGKLADPLGSAEWTNALNATDQMAKAQGESFERSMTKRGLTGGAIGEGLGNLEQSKLKTLEGTLNEIMTTAENKFYGTPPPINSQTQIQNQYVPYTPQAQSSGGGSLLGLLPLMSMFSRGGNISGGLSDLFNFGGGGQLNQGAYNWLGQTGSLGNEWLL